jgi:transaldolase
MTALEQLRIRIFADGADKASMLALCAKPYISGLTTNPTLMRKAGVVSYREFARDILEKIRDKPVCFEVLADDFAGMERQALEIASWGDNVYVKIPITNTRGDSSRALIARLVSRNVKVNVTALTTLAQVREIVTELNPAVASYVSVFAGRIADTGMDPLPVMAQAVEALRSNPNAQLIWASSRELLNIFQAQSIGCPVITLTGDILAKLALVGYDLTQYSLDTVRMFHDDALSAGFSL